MKTRRRLLFVAFFALTLAVHRLLSFLPWHLPSFHEQREKNIRFATGTRNGPIKRGRESRERQKESESE